MNDYKNVVYQSHDGLQLYARDYSSRCAQGSPAILCMHGLTRNSADFEDICEQLAEHYRLIAVDQRGRGRSEHDSNPINYNPAVYVQDMFSLLQELNIESVILLGTSMGGIMAMMMAASHPELIKALIINDIGPEVAPEGLARIQRYVGKQSPVNDWNEAVRQTKEINELAFPALTETDWLVFSKRVYNEDPNGRPVLAYDSAIAEPIDQSDGQSLSLDLWTLFEAINDKPLLVIRGELSDILVQETVEKMRKINSDLHYVEVANVGHAPQLNEERAVLAIQRFLQSVI